jgi:predicted nucleic-acid-binding protein
MKDTVRYIFYIVLILAIGIGATYFSRYINRKFLGIERHDETIKSNSFIKKYDTIINEQQFVIDSLRGIKQKTITIYEKAESDFNDSNIISDDSVLRYIAKKIQD